MSRRSASTEPAGAPRLVRRSEPLTPRAPLLGRHLDKPSRGPVDGDLVIAGWALSADGPLDCVLALVGDAPPLHVLADRPRPDIAAAFPQLDHAEFSGFRLRIPAAACTHLDGDIEIAAQLAGGRRIPLWRLSVGAVGDDDALSAQERPGGADAKQPARRLWGRRRTAASKPTNGLAGTGRTAAPKPTGLREAATAGVGQATREPALRRGPLEDRFRVVALVSTFNEADVIEPVLEHLASQGVWSYMIDDGSTDETVARARRWLGRGLLGIESFENAGGGRTAWRALLARKLELARELGADWYIHHDADEIRESPWPGLTLRAAIAWVDRLGYNAIDFRVLNFVPVDDAFRPGADPRSHFSRWEEAAEYDRLQRKCWRAGAGDTELADGGHDVRFAERRVFPMRFLLRHYPIRGQARGLRKVFQERKGRFAEDELALGWHRQYDHVAEPDHMFLRNPAPLRAFDLDRIRLETMLEDARSHSPADERPRWPAAAPGRGFLDQVSPQTISGWAVREDESEPAQVELWDGGRVFATVIADEPRQDLARQGIAGGRGGFTVTTPRELRDGCPHWIWATLAGSGTALRRSPLVLHAAGPASPTRGSQEQTETPSPQSA